MGDSIEMGVISEVKGDKARAALGDMTTDFLPVLQNAANSYKIAWSPLRVGEQVAVLPLDGSLNSGVIVRGIYQNARPAPATDTNKEISVYSDGASVSYDVSSGTLEILNQKIINIKVANSVNIECESANITAQTTTITSPQITLKGATTIQGAINTSGEGGGAGEFRINGNLTVSGNITDSRGDLTGHSHSDSDGGTSLPR